MTLPSQLPPEMQVLMTTVVAEAAKAASDAAKAHVGANFPDPEYTEALTASALAEAYITFFGPIMAGGKIGDIAAESGTMIAAGLIEVNLEARGR